MSDVPTSFLQAIINDPAMLRTMTQMLTQHVEAALDDFRVLSRHRFEGGGGDARCSEFIMPTELVYNGVTYRNVVHHTPLNCQCTLTLADDSDREALLARLVPMFDADIVIGSTPDQLEPFYITDRAEWDPDWEAKQRRKVLETGVPDHRHVITFSTPAAARKFLELLDEENG